jgi:hypothetical protein
MAVPGVKEAVETALKRVDAHFRFQYFAMLFLLSIVFLFGINPVLSLLGLPAIPVGYRVVAACLSLLTFAGCGYFGLEHGGIVVRKRWQRSQSEKRIRLHFEHLPFDQSEVLRRYIESGKSSISFQSDNGAVRDLERRGILYRSSNEGTMFEGFPYTITPIAEPFLRREEFQKLTLKRKS